MWVMAFIDWIILCHCVARNGSIDRNGMG